MNANDTAAGLAAGSTRTTGAADADGTAGSHNAGFLNRDADATLSSGIADATLVTPDVSVVVPTWRRPALLETCLRALAAQRFDCTRFEIVVCDDGPDAATRSLVASFAAGQTHRGLIVRYLPVTATQGPAAARNAGWRSARAPLVAFTDDDTIPDPDWLGAGAAAAADADAVCGRIEMPLPERPSDYELDASGLARAEFATANVFVRRTVLEAIGGFDDHFTSAWREDSDLQFTLLATGGRILRADDALVVHPVRAARWGVSLRQQSKSRFEALLYRKHPRLYRARIAAMPPLRYYATILCALAAGAAALAGHRVFATCAAVAWLLLTAQFCARRLRHTRRDRRHVVEMAWTSALIPFLSVYWRLYGAARYGVMFL